jgi:hypothetical protein
VGLERDPLGLVSTTEKLLERKSSGSDLENQDYGRRRSAALTTLHPIYIYIYISGKVDTNVAYKRRSLADSRHGVCFRTDIMGSRGIVVG